MTFIGNSAIAISIREEIERAARTASTVLITGESGTGKELIAGAIHLASKRHIYHFEAVNCAGLPDTLIESELFGYSPGAFTGASRTFHGAFERAGEGTIFLDEIGDMPLLAQAKILRTLQNRTIRRLGGAMEIPVGMRVISATNKDLTQEMRKKKFREDLYFRLAVLTMYVPPLRDRKEDIPDLVYHFLPILKKDLELERVPAISDDSMQEFQKYSWPGNVRELRNILQRALALYFDEETLEPEDFFPSASESRRDTVQAFPGILLDTERELILKTLDEMNGNRTHTAGRLGISVRTLRSKLQEYRRAGFEVAVSANSKYGVYAEKGAV